MIKRMPGSYRWKRLTDYLAFLVRTCELIEVDCFHKFKNGYSAKYRLFIRCKNIDTIIRNKDLKEPCPNCRNLMRYKRVRGTMAEWAPGAYAWFCQNCPSTMYDGSIVPGEWSWDTKMMHDERLRIDEYLSFAIRAAMSSDDIDRS